MSVPVEYVEAMVAAGCSAEQVLAVMHADQRRLAVRRMLRRAKAALARGLDPENTESAFRVVKPDSTVIPGNPGELVAGTDIRMAPIKARAQSGLLACTWLKGAAKLVGERLVQHLNLKTGRCDPGIPGLAQHLHLDPRSVRRALAQLEAAGLLERAIHAGRGHSNGYRLDLEAMAALARPLGAKPDSPQMRTLESAKPDNRVRQNNRRKQSFQIPRDRPDPRQPQMLLPLPSRSAVAVSSARRRIHADIADAAEAGDSINVSTIGERDWADADFAETRRKGDGLKLIRQRLSTGPPRQTGTG
jgi:hypothetical protein